MTIEPQRLGAEPDILLPQPVAAVSDRLGRRHWGRLRWFLNVPVLILVLLTIMAVFAPWIAPYSPVTPDIANKLLPPSRTHWFGTDPLGMDVFSRVIYATRTDLVVATGSVLLGIAIGAPLGALAGYQGGWLDAAFGRLTEMVQAFPAILIAMLVLAAAGNNLVTLTILMGILNAPVYLKMVRSVAMPLQGAEFIQAARCSGHRGISLLWKHILPNTLVPIFSQFSISCAFAIQLIAGLSFIGLGVRVPEPEWGSMINEGANYVVFGQWWPSVFPGLAVFIAAFALTSLGNRLRRVTLDE